MRVPATVSLLLCSALVCKVPSSAISAEPAAAPVTRTLEGQRLNDLGLWDLGGDGTFEIFTTAVSGSAGCYRADNLEPLWEKKFSAQPLTAPVIGDFLGTGSPVLAFGAADGEVTFAWPGSGETIAVLKTSYAFSLAPSVAVYTAENKDALVFADDSGQVLVFDLSPDGKARERVKISNTSNDSTAFKIIGRFTHPPSCGDLNHDGIPEVVTTSNSGVLQVVSLTEPPTRSFARLAQQTQASTLAGIGPVADPSRDDIVLGVSASLYVFRWTSGSNAIAPLLQTPAFGQTLGHFILAPMNGDDTADLVSSAQNVIAARYVGSDMKGGQLLLDIAGTQLTTINPPFAPAVPLLKASEAIGIVSIDGKGSVIEWLPLATAENTKEIAKTEAPTTFCPGGRLVRNGSFSLVTWNERAGALSVLPTSADIAANSPPVLTLGANYSRNGQWGGGWSQTWQARIEKAKAALQAAKAGLSGDKKDGESPLDSPSILRGIAPMDESAKTYAVATSSGVMPKALMGLAAFGIIAALGFLVMKKKRR